MQHTNKRAGTAMIALAITLYAAPFLFGRPQVIAIIVAPAALLIVFGALLRSGRWPNNEPTPRFAPTPAQQRAARWGGYALLVVGVGMIALPWIVGIPKARIPFLLAGLAQIVFGALVASGKLGGAR